jgi:signal transduction histidine kinase
MEIAPQAVEVRRGRGGGRFAWATDNPLVRAVGRLPWPLGAKLVAGFTVIAVLLGVGYALGFLALRQSNGRSEQLRVLEKRAAYERLVLTDATQIQRNVEFLLHVTPSQSFLDGFSQALGEADATLLVDAGCPNAGFPYGASLPARTGVGATLFAMHLPFARKLCRDDPFSRAGPSNAGYEHRYAAAFVSKLTRLADGTGARANALVAETRSSYASSRNLLVGVGAGTLVLVLGLGLLLSSSVVLPLRRTRTRLAAIAAGDFSSRVEVPNRDEIGALAADVNRMSDELQRVHRELELASEHKSQFLANMSHEVRTPLNAIIGFSQVLHEQMFGELNERQQGYVEDVLEAGRHLLSLINDVLDLAKIEAGKMELELSQVALAEVLSSAISIHSERASRGGVELALAMEPEAITIAADERRVRQIVFNLVSNAVKFTPPEGRVDVSARLDDGQVEVAVADTGPGIPTEDLETIFEEFEQTAVGKEAEGTGLGLPLSRKLVELHGGRLWAETQPGKGSTFRFTLPAQAEV